MWWAPTTSVNCPYGPPQRIFWGQEAFRGVTGARGFILTKFGVERRHLDLFHARFHDFGHFSVCATDTICLCGTHTAVSVWHTETAVSACHTETAVCVCACVCHRSRLCLLHIDICVSITNGKLPEIMKSGMKQVQVPPFDPKLRQDEATPSRNPPECLPPPKIPKRIKKCEKCVAGSPLGQVTLVLCSDLVTVPALGCTSHWLGHHSCDKVVDS